VASFAHLHLHTSYSFLDGAVRIADLMPALQERGMTAAAITDHGNMYGALDFYLQAKKAGIKPVLGCETYVAPGERQDRSRREAYHLILLARTAEGYQNLVKLVSMAYLDGFYYRPRIDKPLLRENSAGLIGMTACLGGEIPKACRDRGVEHAANLAAEYRDMFEPGCFFLEVQQNGYEEQAPLNEALRKIGSDLGIPLLATNDVHYLHAEDARAHDLLMCIQTGHTVDDPKRNRMHSDQLFLRSQQEMAAALPGYEDAIERAAEVAELCSAEISLNQVFLPDYAVPEGHTLESYLTDVARKGLAIRVEEARCRGASVDVSAYDERLERELETITRMGYAGYYLIVWDFINEAKRRGIPVGPGRGSGAGSLVAYAIRITELDPVAYGLLFERFLNPERVSMPDFDVDFCKNRRDEVIQYVAERYGRDRVGQIATFHQLKARSVVRDVGRVMGMPYQEVDRIAKLVPDPGQGAKITIPKALEVEPRLRAEYESNPKVKELVDYAERLEGLHRHAGTHAGGVVIAPRPLWEHVPVFRGPTGQMATQYDKDMSEACGLVKFDLLGLKTMTTLDTAVRLVNRRPDRSLPLDLLALPLDDPKPYEVIQAGDTTGVFQMESRGFRDLIRRLRPDRFEEIIAVLALYRPGPLQGGMVDDYVERKHGRQPIAYLHEKLRGVLEETYGIIVYQEQVMQAAQVLAGFTLGTADIMRRAMGKKKAEVMAEQRRKFVAGCATRGIPEGKAEEIFDLIDKFAGYGFNKSHSAAYALIAYHTAWLKAHYPVEFLAAQLTCDSDDTDRIALLVAEGRSRGIVFRPPDINESENSFTVAYDSQGAGSIRFGLGALKGVGQSGLDAVFEARQSGPFRDLYDFCARVDLRKVNKGMLEALVKGGAFDAAGEAIGVGRTRTFGAIDAAMERGRTAQRDRDSGQGSLFDALEANDAQPGLAAEAADYPTGDCWEPQQQLAAEREALGLYLSGHPLDRYRDEIKSLANVSVVEIASRANERVRLCGVVEGYKERAMKNGSGRIAFFQLEDLTGRVETLVPSRRVDELGPILQRGEPVICEGTVKLDGESEDEDPRVVLDAVTALPEWRKASYTEVHLRASADDLTRDQLAALRDVVAKHPGRCLLYLHLERPGAWEAVVVLPDRFRVDPSEQMLVELDRVLGRKVLEFRC
jgi:DNA polymerase-3 subunit alpha